VPTPRPVPDPGLGHTRSPPTRSRPYGGRPPPHHNTCPPVSGPNREATLLTGTAARPLSKAYAALRPAQLLGPVIGAERVGVSVEDAEPEGSHYRECEPTPPSIGSAAIRVKDSRLCPCRWGARLPGRRLRTAAARSAWDRDGRIRPKDGSTLC